MLFGQDPTRTCDGSAADDRHKSAHTQFRPLLKYPLETVSLQRALEKRQLHLRLALHRRPRQDQARSPLAVEDLDAGEKGRPAVVEQSDRVPGRKSQDVAKLVCQRRQVDVAFDL